MSSVPSATLEKLPPDTLLTVGRHQVEIVKYLSEGGFAHIYIVKINPSENNSDIACLKRVIVPNKEGLNQLRAEVEVMQRLATCDQVVKYYDSNASRIPNTSSYEVLVLMELCTNKSLLDYMNSKLKTKLSEIEILKIMYDISRAVYFMHSQKLIHRDIKIENVLIDSGYNFKLADFGSTCPFLRSPKNQQEFQMLCNDIMHQTTPQYRSPEMIDLYRGSPIDEKSDIWALGIFLYKLCYYITPFEQAGELAILHAAYDFPHAPIYSSNLKKLIISMLLENPIIRPNIVQIVYQVGKLLNLDSNKIESQYKDFYNFGPYNFENEYCKTPQKPYTASVIPQIYGSINLNSLPASQQQQIQQQLLYQQQKQQQQSTKSSKSNQPASIPMPSDIIDQSSSSQVDYLKVPGTVGAQLSGEYSKNELPLDPGTAAIVAGELSRNNTQGSRISQSSSYLENVEERFPDLNSNSSSMLNTFNSYNPNQQQYQQQFQQQYQQQAQQAQQPNVLSPQLPYPNVYQQPQMVYSQQQQPQQQLPNPITTSPVDSKIERPENVQSPLVNNDTEEDTEDITNTATPSDESQKLSIPQKTRSHPLVVIQNPSNDTVDAYKDTNSKNSKKWSNNNPFPIDQNKSSTSFQDFESNTTLRQEMSGGSIGSFDASNTGIPNSIRSSNFPIPGSPSISGVGEFDTGAGKTSGSVLSYNNINGGSSANILPSPRGSPLIMGNSNLSSNNVLMGSSVPLMSLNNGSSTDQGNTSKATLNITSPPPQQQQLQQQPDLLNDLKNNSAFLDGAHMNPQTTQPKSPLYQIHHQQYHQQQQPHLQVNSSQPPSSSSPSSVYSQSHSVLHPSAPMTNITGNTSSNDLLGSSSGSRRSLSSNQHLDARFNSQENVSRHGSNGNPGRLGNSNHMANELLSNYGSRSDLDLSASNSNPPTNNSNNNNSNILVNSSIKKNSVGSVNSSDGINNLSSGLLRAKSLKVRPKSTIINPSAMLPNNLTGNSGSNIQTSSNNRGFRKSMVSEEVVNLSDDDDENY
ncbi:hypothetical protein BVG19_g4941 [[Candida] boidinii]|nr:hypothetical protein BVG19_g4941 [[Candida] boidinii]OWB53538.1 hypothetical protein B5S27_g5139 [[Candida] boidinii]